MKTREELIAIKEEVEALNRKLTELSDDELKQVIGGYTTVHEEDLLHEMKLPDFNLN